MEPAMLPPMPCEASPLSLADDMGADALTGQAPDSACAEPAPVAGEEEQFAALLAPIQATQDVLADHALTIATEVAALGGQVAELVRLGEQREATIDRLHAENQALRAGEREQALVPVFRDLIALHDALDGLATRHAAEGAAVAAADIARVQESVVDLLARYDVESYTADVNAAFVAKEHRAVKTLETSDPAQHLTVVAVHRVGFRTPAHVIRALEVSVRRTTQHLIPTDHVR